ncbi:MAG: isochorismatase family protein [Deltaproteobacteria bacterium]|nr:isochorismatase family protein [Deltaproteobacteria bacterium]
MPAGTPRHPRLLDRDAAVVVVIDVQEAYRSVLHEYERVARAVAVLVQGAAALGVPVLATEQYPKGLGHTAAEVAEHLPRGVAPIEKLSLSCCGTPLFVSTLARLRRRQVVLAGIETHACVSQTAHDLIAAGYAVHLPRDTTSSRRAEDAAIGWEKMLSAGVIPATVESALLELLRTAEAPEFKAVQCLIR